MPIIVCNADVISHSVLRSTSTEHMHTKETLPSQPHHSMPPQDDPVSITVEDSILGRVRRQHNHLKDSICEHTPHASSPYGAATALRTVSCTVYRHTAPSYGYSVHRSMQGSRRREPSKCKESAPQPLQTSLQSKHFLHSRVSVQ